MVPTINPGDLMWVNAMVDYEDIQVGDMVVFTYGSTFVGHRVVNDTGDALITKGDANTFLDPPLTEDRYVGRIDAVWKFGEVGQFIAPPFLFVWMACAAMCVGIIVYSRHRRRAPVGMSERTRYNQI